MDGTKGRLYVRHVTTLQARARAAAWTILHGAVALVWTGAASTPGRAQQDVSSPAAVAQAGTAPLVFDEVTVVDVEQGMLIPDQRVVIVGNRIQVVGATGAVQVPKGAHIVNAQRKYLIPGLWDMHFHPWDSLFYPLLIATGVTGFREASSQIPLAALVELRREILAGTRVGPPRQIFSGKAISAEEDCSEAGVDAGNHHTCMVSRDSASARELVTQLKAAGADMLKTYNFYDQESYFLFAAAARRAGLPFGGHLYGSGLTASDSGMSIVDHSYSGAMNTTCAGFDTNVEQCRQLADRFRKNNTWWAPTLVTVAPTLLNGKCCLPNMVHLRRISAFFRQQAAEFWAGRTLLSNNWLQMADSGPPSPHAHDYLRVAEAVGLPILAGSDAIMWVRESMQDYPPGHALHAELAILQAEGLSPLHALQAATLNPAKFWRATDSLGTVAPGKLADLVLLDANPLEDITNTTTIRAVVANGRYFDRATLDRFLTEIQEAARPQP